MDRASKPAPERIEAELPAEMAQAFNLMAHPLAGMAAMTAIGFGMASHALGVWAGAMSGAASASRRLAPKVAEAMEPVVVRTDVATAPRQESPKASADVLTLIKDARTAVESRARAVAEAAAASPPVAETAAAKVAAAKAIAPNAAPARAEGVAKVARKPIAAPARAKPARVDAPAKAATSPASAAPAMAQPKAAEKPVTPDDLKAISGVGPKLEQVLNGFGIWTYGQIAALEKAELAWLEDRLGFKGRIERDDWIGQAKALAAARAKG